MSLVQSFQRYRNSISQDSPRALQNPWILAWLGVIVVFLLVNLIFIVYAFVTSPGLVAEDYYDKGQNFEQNVLKMRAAQKALGWETKLATPETIVINRTDTYRFSAVDARGVPVMDAHVTLVAYRPSDADADIELPLRQVAPGQYQGRLSLPLPGIWDINISVQDGDNNYQTGRRVMAQQAP